jgi:hypothetical protein
MGCSSGFRGVAKALQAFLAAPATRFPCAPHARHALQDECRGPSRTSRQESLASGRNLKIIAKSNVTTPMSNSKWLVLPADVSPPDWSIDFLVWVGGIRITLDGKIETLSGDELGQLEDRFVRASTSSHW